MWSVKECDWMFIVLIQQHLHMTHGTLILLFYCCCQHPLQWRHQGCCLCCNDQKRVRFKGNKSLMWFNNLKHIHTRARAQAGGYLRIELVLTLHVTCRFFPSKSTTFFSVTSSRLGTSSVGPVFSTCLSESDLERDNSPSEKSHWLQ